MAQRRTSVAAIRQDDNCSTALLAACATAGAVVNDELGNRFHRTSIRCSVIREAVWLADCNPAIRNFRAFGREACAGTGTFLNFSKGKAGLTEAASLQTP